MSDIEPGAPLLTGYDKSNGQAGILAPSRTFLDNGYAGTAMTANRANLMRFVPSRDMLITNFRFCVTAALTGNVDVGLFNASLARLISSGSTAGQLSTTGWKSVAITPTLVKAGITYFAGIACDVAVSLFGPVSSGAFGADAFGAADAVREAHFQAAAFPLPASIADSGVAATYPCLAVMEA